MLPSLLAQTTEALGILDRFGFPVFCTVVLGGSVGLGLWWIGKNIVKPLVDAHIGFLKVLQDSIKGLQEGFERMEKKLENAVIVDLEGKALVVKTKDDHGKENFTR